MQSLYYYPNVTTGSTLYFFPNNDTPEIFSGYNTTNLIVCSSLYQILIYSGSSILFSVPIENTNLYYINDTTESLYPPIKNITGDPGYDITSEFLSSSFNLVFSPDINITSSNNKLIITGSEVSILQSQSFNTQFFQVNSGSSFSITLSGSGQYYDATLLITNNNLVTTESYVSSSNTPLFTSFTASETSYTYNIEARIDNIPSIGLTYDSSSNIPVIDSGSVDEWNSFLNISASRIELDANIVYLLGGNINTITALTLPETGSEYLTDVSILGANDLILFILTTGSLSSFPTLSGTPNLQYIVINSASLNSSNLPTGLTYLDFYNICNNNISGSISSITQNISQSISILSCSFNNLTGSIPALSSIPSLGYLDCSYNQLSGSITGFSSSYGLYYFNCSNNALTGSLPNLSDLISLSYFNCSHNKLSGSISTLESSSLLEYFNVSNNNLTGSIPFLTSNTNLSTFIARNNQISGFPDPEAGGPVPFSLTYIDLENNNLSGTNLIRLAGSFYSTFSGSFVSGYINVSGSGNASATSSIDIINNFNELTASGWTIYANDYP